MMLLHSGHTGYMQPRHNMVVCTYKNTLEGNKVVYNKWEAVQDPEKST